MKARRQRGPLLAVGAMVLLIGTAAQAAPRARKLAKADEPVGPAVEARARALGRRAMDGSYDAGNVKDAREALVEALGLCGLDRCRATLTAGLWRDLAVCDDALGKSDEELAASLREALQREPTLTLEAHRRSPRLAHLYDETRRSRLGGNAPSSPVATATEVPRPPPRAGMEPSAPARAPRLWVGLEGSVDIALVASTDDVCSLDGDRPLNAGHYCTISGSDYPGRSTPAENDAVQRGQLDSVRGGPTLGSARIKLRLDWALDEHWLAGLRVGYVLGTYPGDAAHHDGRAWLPIDLEARATYHIGKRPLSAGTTSQYVYLGAGVTETEASVDVDVVDRAGRVRTAQAWQLGGALYVAAGLGVRVGLTPNVGVLVGPRFALPLVGGTHLAVLAPELAVQVGF